MIFIRVDLPDPEGPMMARYSPVGTIRSMPCRTSTRSSPAPKDLRMPASSSISALDEGDHALAGLQAAQDLHAVVAAPPGPDLAVDQAAVVLLHGHDRGAVAGLHGPAGHDEHVRGAEGRDGQVGGHAGLELG